MVQYALGITWLFMSLIWVVSVIKKDVSIVDIAYAFNFIIIGWVYYLSLKQPSSYDSLFLSAINLWGIRLSLHIAYKNKGKGEDKRYMAFRKNYGPERYWWFSYFQVFLLQWFLAMIFAMPIHIYFTQPNMPYDTKSMILVATFLVYVFGFFYESIADYQLLRFKTKNSSSSIMNKGLWRLSRHPNYFGEIILWYGLALTTIAHAPSAITLIALIGPLALNYTIVCISGPSMQTSNLKSTKPGYSEYMQKTPRIVPKIY